jgi:hypothetical protein
MKCTPYRRSTNDVLTGGGILLYGTYFADHWMPILFSPTQINEMMYVPRKYIYVCKSTIFHKH